MINEKEKIDNIVNLYYSGCTIRDIAAQINLSYEKVRQILKTAKIVFRKRYLSDLQASEIQEIISQFESHKTIEEIANNFGFSPPAISRLLKANNKQIICSSRKYDILRQTPISFLQKQFIVGTVLGDGCLYKDNKNSNFKLSFSHCKAAENYFHWKICMMDPFINNFRENIDKRGNSIMLQTSSICHKDLNVFGEMFYTESRKKIVPDKLEMYLTPLALATWIQDDGHLNQKVNMRIASHGFSEADNYKLRDYLKACFDLNSKVMGFKYKNKQYYQITLNKENTQKLSDIVRPHISNCMLYKIMPESSTTTC